ncbi:hypothetical protein Q5O24_01165 [Eubacteriaceae bacterium ES3]|nr:hypothetical protein Q5O24_01165 [Eubacteriaceae bacterium ES3]
MPELYIMLLATFVRIFLSLKLSVWYKASDVYDDQLLINYADLTAHFLFPDIWSLVKTMSYPLFLNFVHLTGLSYSMVMALIWVVAALLLVRVFKVVSDNRVFLTFVYLFTLFTPSAFDNWLGTRLYRNALIAPFVVITFSLMILIVFKLLKYKKISAWNIFVSSLLLGFIFTFTFYLKEDGVWLLPCLCLAIFVSAAIAIYRYFRYKKTELAPKRVVLVIITLLLPVMIFVAGTNAYKMLNEHYFGVAEINTRTEGALGEFVSNIYKIKSDIRDPIHWAPKDSIDKAFKVSKTLKQYPELKDAIFNSPWLVGGIDESPIEGDFLTWVLRTALLNTGIWENEVQIEELFEQVNNELEEAFQSNLLEEDPKIQISSSGGGRTIEEILQLTGIVKQEYFATVFLRGYQPGGQLWEYEDPESIDSVEELINEKIMTSESETDYYMANQLVKIIFKIYALLNPVLLILCIFSMIFIVIQIIRKKTNQEKEAVYIFTCLMICALVGISVIYAYAIAWFAEFLLDGVEYDWTILKFYSVGLVPLLMLVELLGAYLFSEIINESSFLPLKKYN